MPDVLPSIEDLLKKKTATGTVAAPSSNTPASAALAPDEEETVVAKTREQLQEKIGDIALQGKEREAQGSASVLGVEYIDLKGFPISPDALTLVPQDQAVKLKAITFLDTGPEFRLAAVQPDLPEIKDLLHQIEERHKSHGAIYQMTEESFQEALKLYETLPKIRNVVKGVQIKQEELEKYQSQMNTIEDIGKVLLGARVTDVLAVVVAAALKLNSSDIHVEAEEKGIAVRFRVDGILQEAAVLEKEQWKKIINRVKLIAGLKLNINDRPQDGRFTIYQSDKKIDVRTSTLPTAWGESAVMRLLNPDTVQLEFAQLGFREASLKKLMSEIEKPNGMIVTTGPTGSGKTTTLYAILKHLNKPGVKIITLEDPVEYKLEGINQSQIDHSKDYTFGKGLRSILRQDPDIVMVGEIRDLETAETAIQASLTGHLLISTIHTNDAAGAIPRFISMGVKPFLLAPSVNAIMGQRLARRLCKECKKPAEVTPEQLAKVKEILDAIPPTSGEKVPEMHTFYAPGSCEACNNTGYKGRVGLYEILIKDESIEKFILTGEISEYAVRDVAAAQGMVTMAQDGLLKALEGATSIEEVQRVTGF
jgi:type IV pilus assembly protein PilB